MNWDVIMILKLGIKTLERRFPFLKNNYRLVNIVEYILATNNELHGLKESKLIL